MIVSLKCSAPESQICQLCITGKSSFTPFIIIQSIFRFSSTINVSFRTFNLGIAQDKTTPNFVVQSHNFVVQSKQDIQTSTTRLIDGVLKCMNYEQTALLQQLHWLLVSVWMKYKTALAYVNTSSASSYFSTEWGLHSFPGSSRADTCMDHTFLMKWLGHSGSHNLKRGDIGERG